MKLRAAIYARFSSENQHEESIEAQVQICKEYCKKKGYLVVKLYTDEAKSGTTTRKRDSYRLMLEDARQDIYDIIIFHKIDRNARNEFDYYHFKDEILSLGKQYAYAGQSLDASPEGQLMENNLVGFAAYFSRNLSKEVKKGQMVRAEKALFLGGKPPLGYKVVNQKYVIDEDSAGAVRMIFDLYNQDYGYTFIIMSLNSAGYKTSRGKSFGKNSLHDILCNEIYRGTYTFGKRIKIMGKCNSHRWNENPYRIENAVPAIISDTTWKITRGKMQKRKTAPGTLSAKVPYLLSGLVECGECHGKMSGYSNGTEKYPYFWYKCCNQNNHGTDTCHMEKVKKEYLEDKVISSLISTLTPAFIKKVIARSAEMYNQIKSQNGRKIAELSSRKANAVKKLNNLYSVIENGIADDYDLRRLSSVKSEISFLDEELAAYKHSPNLISENVLYSQWSTLLHNLRNEINPYALKSLLSQLISRVVVTRERFYVDVSDLGAVSIGATRLKSKRSIHMD